MVYIIRLLEEGGEPFGKLRTGLKFVLLYFVSLRSSYDPSGKNIMRQREGSSLPGMVGLLLTGLISGIALLSY